MVITFCLPFQAELTMTIGPGSIYSGESSRRGSLLSGTCSRKSRKQLVERNRKVAHSNTRRVEHCIGDGRARTADPEFSDALDAEMIRFVVEVLEHDRIDRWDVGMYRDEVFGKIAIHVVAVAGVHERSFMERRTRTPDHPADQLRSRGLRIDDTPRGEHSQHSAQPHFAGHVVNRNFCETGTVRIL